MFGPGHPVAAYTRQRSGTPFNSRSPSVSEGQAGTGESLTVWEINTWDGLGERCDSGSDADGDPADLAIDDLALAGVDPGPDLDAKVADTLKLISRAQRIARAGPSKVASSPSPAVSFSTPRHSARVPRTRVVALHEVLPGMVTDGCLPFGRPDDVGEHTEAVPSPGLGGPAPARRSGAPPPGRPQHCVHRLRGGPVVRDEHELSIGNLGGRVLGLGEMPIGRVNEQQAGDAERRQHGP